MPAPDWPIAQLVQRRTTLKTDGRSQRSAITGGAGSRFSDEEGATRETRLLARRYKDRPNVQTWPDKGQHEPDPPTTVVVFESKLAREITSSHLISTSLLAQSYKPILQVTRCQPRLQRKSATNVVRVLVQVVETEPLNRDSAAPTAFSSH